jgi:hypothetical protein
LVINSDLTLIADETGEKVFAQTGSNPFSGLDGRELFSFGNGAFFDGIEAKEMAASGISCSMTAKTYVILEKKKIFNHLADLPCLETAQQLGQVLRMLEDAGEVGVRVSHHTVSGDEIQHESLLVFGLEQETDRPRKKAKGNKKARDTASH